MKVSVHSNGAPAALEEEMKMPAETVMLRIPAGKVTLVGVLSRAN